MSKIKIGINSCLLGEEDRFNGGHKRPTVCTTDLSKYFCYKSICPEISIELGTPRKPMRLVGDHNNPKVVDIIDASIDVTNKLQQLKSKQPSTKEFSQQLWPAGEPHALKRLEHFCSQVINDYKINLNIPSLDGTSSLSPYLSCGIISARECWHQAQYYLENEGTLTWQNELLWRKFYKHVVVHYPYICKKLPWKEKAGSIQWQNDKVAFNQWYQGLTGFPLVDAAIRQLLETGWMHNRLRMITALFLSKNLLIDWRLGEKWFMQHLIDGDFSSNNGGWQWSASTGMDAVPYFRIFNPIRQSQQYDSQGNFIKHYLPELEHIDHKKIHRPIMRDAINYPQPIIDLTFSRELALNTFKQLSSELY